MDSYDVNPLVLKDVLDQLGDADVKPDYIVFEKKYFTKKRKAWFMRLSETVQRGILWLMFLYIPAYVLLMVFNVTPFYSVFSLYYLASYFVIIGLFILLNRESHGFKNTAG